MKEAGLFFVYMGIEDGTEEGLALMNKRVSADTHCRAVETLKKLGMEYDFGFMLFHPDSTFRSISQNLGFLKRICGDGSSPITFGKMLPYAETQIEYRLKSEGRLKGPPGFEDYDLRILPWIPCIVSCQSASASGSAGPTGCSISPGGRTIRWARITSTIGGPASRRPWSGP